MGAAYATLRNLKACLGCLGCLGLVLTLLIAGIAIRHPWLIVAIVGAWVLWALARARRQRCP